MSPWSDGEELWRGYGKYRALLPEQTIYRSKVLPGFWLDSRWLWAEELPNPLQSLAQIIGTDALLGAIQG